MSKPEFYQYALSRVPAGKHIVAINYHAFQGRYVAVLAKAGTKYPFTGKIYEP